MAGILFSSLLILFVLGVPVAFSMGLASIFAMMDSGISLQVVIQRVFSSLDSFPLMAIPFFILAGNIMEYSGISQRLINLANSIVGHVTGGLGMVTVLTAMFFAAISGSSAATTAAIGSILIPVPIGVNLFVACQIAGLRIEQIMKSMLPFYLMLIIDILLVTYLPQITLWLPSILK